MGYLLVFAGGALGSLARYEIGLGLTQFWQLLLVNTLGSLLLGALRKGNKLYLFLGTGFACGFTTLSAVSVMIGPATTLETIGQISAMLGAGFAAYLIGSSARRAK